MVNVPRSHAELGSRFFTRKKIPCLLYCWIELTFGKVVESRILWMMVNSRAGPILASSILLKHHLNVARLKDEHELIVVPTS